jgi:hypothetical protein
MCQWAPAFVYLEGPGLAVVPSLDAAAVREGGAQVFNSMRERAGVSATSADEARPHPPPRRRTDALWRGRRRSVASSVTAKKRPQFLQVLSLPAADVFVFFLAASLQRRRGPQMPPASDVVSLSVLPSDKAEGRRLEAPWDSIYNSQQSGALPHSCTG